MNHCHPSFRCGWSFPSLSAQGQFLTPRGAGQHTDQESAGGVLAFSATTSIFRFDGAHSDDRYPGREDSCQGALHHQPSPSGLWLEHCAPFG